MKKGLSIFVLILFGFSSTNKEASELDLIHVYDLKIGNAPLFGSIHEQLNVLGLPKQISQHHKQIAFKTSNDVLSAVKKGGEFSIVSFEGIEFWCFSDLESIPSKIDFRRLEKKVSDKKMVFSKNYELNDFEKDFPNSFKNSPKMAVSFFQMATNESLNGLKHYYIERVTKSDPENRPLVEFTFKDDKLIYIFFANF